MNAGQFPLTEDTGRRMEALLERILDVLERAPIQSDPAPLAGPVLGAMLGGMTADDLKALNKQRRTRRKP